MKKREGLRIKHWTTLTFMGLKQKRMPQKRLGSKREEKPKE